VLARDVQIGIVGSGFIGAKLETLPGSIGALTLSKNGEADVQLDKDHLDNVVGVLLGGSAVNADALHVHKVIEHQFLIGGQATSANVTAPNLNTLVAGAASNADALHIHKALQSQFTIGGVATSANVTASNLSTLTAGVASSADALHHHPQYSLTTHNHDSTYVHLTGAESIAG